MQVARFYEEDDEVVFDNKLEPVIGIVVEAERKKRVGTWLVRFIHHKTRDSKEPAKTKIVGPNLEIWQKIPSRSGMKKSNKIS